MAIGPIGPILPQPIFSQKVEEKTKGAAVLFRPSIYEFLKSLQRRKRFCAFMAGPACRPVAASGAADDGTSFYANAIDGTVILTMATMSLYGWQ